MLTLLLYRITVINSSFKRSTSIVFDLCKGQDFCSKISIIIILKSLCLPSGCFNHCNKNNCEKDDGLYVIHMMLWRAQHNARILLIKKPGANLKYLVLLHRMRLCKFSTGLKKSQLSIVIQNAVILCVVQVFPSSSQQLERLRALAFHHRSYSSVCL